MRNARAPGELRSKMTKPVRPNSPVSSFSASLCGAALRWRFAWAYPESEPLAIFNVWA